MSRAPATFFPGQLIPGADGSFGINVTGHIHAEGLDLDASTSSTPPNTDRLRWLKADGTVAADLYGYDDGTTGALILEAGRPVSSPQWAGIEMDSTNVASRVRAFANPGGFSNIIINSAGASNYLQLANLLKRTLVWGSVATGLGTINSTGSGDWSVSTPGGVGTALITFATQRTVTPLVWVTVNGGGAFFVDSVGPTLSSVTVRSFSAASPTLTNANVSFLIIG